MVCSSVARSARVLCSQILFLLVFSFAQAHAQTTCSDTAVTGVPASECQALLDLYNATGGDSWTRNSGWNTASAICNWDGIECSSGHVTLLHLTQNNLVGTLPSSIGNLVELTDLRLAAKQYDTSLPTDIGLNHLSGVIPDSIGNLTKLQALDLMENQFSGAIPESIGNLVLLTFLGLRTNQFTSGIPSSFGNLTLLTQLDLRSSNLTGSIPSELGNLVNLNALILSNNHLSGSIPPELGSLTQLQLLALDTNQLTGTIPTALENLVNLRMLALFANQLEGSIPDIFGGMAALVSIDIGNQTSAAKLSGPLPQSIFTRTQLIALRIPNQNLSGGLPDSIGNLPNLRHLQLAGNQLSGVIPNSIGNDSSLDILDLGNNQFECEVPNSITAIAGLQDGSGYDYINLSYNRLFAEGSTLAWLNAKVGPAWLSTQNNDQDGDGIYDCQDGCAADSAKATAGVCGCGVSDVDSDGDGTPDCNDLCPGDSNKITPGACGCGAIEQDANHDGICDAAIPTPYYSVSGTVRLRNGQPLEGATVHSVKGEAITDRNGNYTIRNIPGGSYTFYVREWDEGYSISRDFKMNLIPGRTCPAAELPLDDHLKSPECKFDPLLVDQNLTQMDFKVNRCINPDPGVVYIEDENGHCIRENTPPSTPLNLTASDGTSTAGVDLSWTLTPGATSYQIYRTFAGSSESPASGTLVDQVSGVSYLDTSAVPGVHYDYAVRAINRYGTSSLSNTDEGWRASSGGSSSGGGTDSDGDGVPDDQERQDGTDPMDPGSFETVLQSPAFTKYNTFLSQFNWLELIGAGSKPVAVKVTIYSLDGRILGAPINETVNPQAEVDIDIHSRVPEDTYGIVRIDFDDSDPMVRLVGRMTVYRRDPNQEALPVEQQTFSFAFTRELRNPTRGVTYGTANSIDPQGMGFLVPNWAELVNLESAPKEFTIRVYNQAGTLLSQKIIAVPALGEFDVQAGHEFGEGVYLVQIMPHDGSAQYLSTITRYSSNSHSGNEADTYNFAMPIDARVGTSDHQFVPMSNLHGTCWLQTNWIEVTNVRAAQSVVDLRFRTDSGQVIAELPSIVLNAHAQEHFNASSILDLAGKDLYGSVEIAPRDRGSVLVQSNFYYHDCEKNSLQTAYSSRGQISGPSVQMGTFNRFLGMNNLLHVINTSPDNLDLGLELRDSQNGLLGEQAHSLSPFTALDLNLSDGSVFHTNSDTYGTVMLSATDKRKLVVENVRLREINGRVDFAIATGVR